LEVQVFFLRAPKRPLAGPDIDEFQSKEVSRKGGEEEKPENHWLRNKDIRSNPLEGRKCFKRKEGRGYIST
jgi:hypothetical protein